MKKKLLALIFMKEKLHKNLPNSSECNDNEASSFRDVESKDEQIPIESSQERENQRNEPASTN